MNPQAARNVGARIANGELLAFTDPDIYPPSEWLSSVVGAYERTHGIVLGAIACHVRRRLDLAAHLCRFNVCLPVSQAGPVPMGWSGNILMARRAFDALGGWDAAHTQGDATFTAQARSAGHELWFEPDAVVYHDHAGVGLRAFLREHYARRCEFG
jgi:GT2 family glycosyltransferase